MNKHILPGTGLYPSSDINPKNITFRKPDPFPLSAEKLGNY